MRTKSSRDFDRRLLYCFSSPTVELVWPRRSVPKCSVIRRRLLSLFTSVIMSRIDGEVMRQAKYMFMHGWVQSISTALLKISTPTSSYQQTIASEDAGSVVPDKSHTSLRSNSELQSSRSSELLTIGMTRRRSTVESQWSTFLTNLNGFPIVEIPVRFGTTRSTDRTLTTGKQSFQTARPSDVIGVHVRIDWERRPTESIFSKLSSQAYLHISAVSRVAWGVEHHAPQWWLQDQ